MTITNKQARFIDEYLVDFNATQAAIRAGYSKRSAQEIGAENLSKPIIRDEVQRIISERAMGKDEVLQRLADQARGDLADLMDITSTGYTFRLMQRDDDGNLIVNPKTRLIKKIKQKVTTLLSKKNDGYDREIIETELELYSSQAALELLGKYHKLFVDRTSHEDPDGRPLGTAVDEVRAALMRGYSDKDKSHAANG